MHCSMCSPRDTDTHKKNKHLKVYDHKYVSLSVLKFNVLPEGYLKVTLNIVKV